MSKAANKTDESLAGINQDKNLRRATSVMKCLSHPVRLSILCHLIDKGEMSAGEIVEYERDKASQSQVSQYLKILRDMKFVNTRREGLTIYYRITSEEISELIHTMHGIFCK